MKKNNQNNKNFKEKVIECYNKKLYKITELLNIFQISNGTLYNWIKRYNSKTLDQKQKEEKLTSVAKCYIRSYVISRINFKYTKLISLLYKKYNISICKSTLYSCIFKLKITRKKIRKRVIYTSKDKKKIQLTNFKKEIEKENLSNIISIDETSVDTHISNDYGWSIKGKRIETFMKYQRIRYTVISAISNKKIILNKIIKGAANGQIFLDFIIELLQLIGPTKSILLDNARIHHSLLLKAYMENKPNKIIYNVPYSPEYNPIEKVFSKIKHKLKNGTHTNNNIKNHILNSFKNITVNDLQHFYEKSLIF